MENLDLSADTAELLNKAARSSEIWISTATAWEIGLLASKRGMTFDPDPKSWFEDALRRPGSRLLALGPEIAIDAWQLPEPFHRDPADRLLVASARHHDLALVTRDRRILAYAEAGHLRAMAC